MAWFRPVALVALCVAGTALAQGYIPSGGASGASGISALTGDVTASGSGSVAAAVALVGGSSAANVHLAEVLANASASANTASAIVKRDGSGNFSAGTITASLTGNASGSSGSFTGSLVGDVTGTQGATVLSNIPSSLTATGAGGITITSSMANSGTNAAFVVNTSAALTGTAVLMKMCQAGFCRLILDGLGNEYLDSAIYVPLIIGGSRTSYNGGGGVSTVRIIGSAADGAAAFGVSLETNVTLSTSGAVITKFVNNGTKKADVDKDGVGNVAGITVSGTTHGGQSTMSTGTNTVTVASGCKPICMDTTSPALLTQCSVSSTTLSIAAGTSDVVTYLCI